MQIELANPSACETPGVLFATNGSADYSEEEVVAAARLGSPVAFQRLVECYESRILRIAQRIAHSREDAEDIKQIAFVQAFKNMDRFRGDSRFFTWLGRIAINEGLMRVRRGRVKEISLDDAIETEAGGLLRTFEDHRPNPEECYSREELRNILAKMMARLSPAYRAVLQLHDLRGFSICETAGALEITPSAAKSRLRRARLQMRKLLKHHFNPPIRHKTASCAGRMQVASFLVLPSRRQASMRKP